MKIGIDVRMWSESGIGRYVRNLVRELVSLDKDNEYFLFALEKDRGDIERCIGDLSDRWVVVNAEYRWYSFAEQLFLPWDLYRKRLDIVHFPHFNVPLMYFRPFITTIHDLTHFTHAMRRASTLGPFLYAIKHHAYSIVFSYAVQRSRSVVSVSNYVKREIVSKFGLPENKIVVTYESADSSDVHPTTPAGFPLKGPYFFYVGNAHPHKNIEFLLRSFYLFRKDHPEYYLVLSGKRNYFWKQVEKYAREENISENVVFTGYVSDEELQYLYNHTSGFVFPSLSEGFGLPLLEAMRSGAPVLSSNSSCLPEIAGDAALFFDPCLEESLVSCMNRVIIDSRLADELRQHGYVRVKDFSWRAMAERTLELYC